MSCTSALIDAVQRWCELQKMWMCVRVMSQLLPYIVTFIPLIHFSLSTLLRWCSLFNADLALSVTMTAISTLLSVIVMPLNILFYCKFAYDADIVQSLDFRSLFVALGVVISAISLGLLASAKIHSYRFNILANRLGNYAGLSLVAFSALVSNTGGETKIWEHSWKFYVGVMLPCVAGLILANIMTTACNINKPERV